MACTAAYAIAKAFVSVRLSVSQSNAWIMTKRKKIMPTFLYRVKDHSS